MKKDKAVEVVVETTGLKKVFGDLTAVRDFNLEVRRGSIYGLVGPNAAGKTTALRMMIGKLRPTAGKVKVLGLDIPAQTVKIRHRIGVMPQSLALYSDLSARENLMFFGALQGFRGDKLRHRIGELERLMKLEEPMDRVVSQLSGGTIRRLSLACTLIHSPELLFLDEPTVGIDPVFRDALWSHFKALRDSGVTIVLTTHYLAEVENCDTVGMMREGKVILEGDPASLRSKFGGATLEDIFIRVAQGKGNEESEGG
nr:ABC transporter ATP-binding protein [Candidatus Njordarchaeum guaymaensis]